jgi:F0F1-type ATP synthase epsilon subunit
MLNTILTTIDITAETAANVLSFASSRATKAISKLERKLSKLKNAVDRSRVYEQKLRDVVKRG